MNSWEGGIVVLGVLLILTVLVGAWNESVEHLACNNDGYVFISGRCTELKIRGAEQE